jgi:hypothetical protein
VVDHKTSLYRLCKAFSAVLMTYSTGQCQAGAAHRAAGGAESSARQPKRGRLESLDLHPIDGFLLLDTSPLTIAGSSLIHPPSIAGRFSRPAPFLWFFL